MDLTTRYMGLDLKNPLVASASPLNADLGNLKRLEDVGTAAVVLPSLFEEQIEAETARYDHLTGVNAESSPEAQSYFPAPADYKVGPRQYLDLVRRASGVARHSRHRQPKRHDRPWLDFLRQVDRGSRRRGTGTQYLLHPR